MSYNVSSLLGLLIIAIGLVSENWKTVQMEKIEIMKGQP